MRFTVVATGQFSPGRAFGFSLAASSLTQLSVVNSPIRPTGLSPAWQPASPAHTRTPKLPVVAGRTRPPRSAPVPGRSNWLHSNHGTFSNRPPAPHCCGRDGRTPPMQKFNFGIRDLSESQTQHVRQFKNPWNFPRFFGNPSCCGWDTRAPFHWGNAPRTPPSFCSGRHSCRSSHKTSFPIMPSPSLDQDTVELLRPGGRVGIGRSCAGDIGVNAEHVGRALQRAVGPRQHHIGA